MKISVSWLKDFIKINESPEVLAEMLTQTGLEVEGVTTAHSIPGGLEGMVIGEVLSCEQHPNADKLSKTTVNIGETTVPIVCGAPNVAVGQKVVVATVGAMLYPVTGEPFQIKKAKIRGEVSEGMICAEDEIGLGQSHDGIMVLDTKVANGTAASIFFNIEPETTIEIGLTPNRADAASHLGVARDVRAVTGREIVLPDLSTFKVENTSLPIAVHVENTEACPRYSALSITNVKVGPSPDWLKNRLKSIGLTPINNIVDITNYICHGLGQPMHAFDAAKIKGQKVIVKTLPEGTPFVTLDEKERKLQAQDLMICDGEGSGMCIAGVFGGNHSGVTEQTTSLFLESAYFSPEYIRRSAQHHQLKTDASFRYERGTDPNITVVALKWAASLIKELAKGEVSSEIVDVYPQAIEPFAFSVKYKYINKLIGQTISPEEINKILKNLDIEVVNKTDHEIQVKVQPYRVDVQRPADIVEEILRVYGFNKIPLSEELKSDFLANFPKIDPFKSRLNVSRLLSSNGYFEIFTNSLTKASYAQKSTFLDEGKSVEILNKLSEDTAVLRQTLVYTGLESIARNINYKQTNVKFYEFGTIYKTKEDGYLETAQLALFLTGNHSAETWIEKNAHATYHDLLGLVDKILTYFGISKYKQTVIQEDPFAYGLEITLRKDTLVRIGLLSPGVCKEAGVKQAVFYAELNWPELLKQKGKLLSHEPISRFPEVRRDLSLVVDKRVSFDEIKKVAQQNGGSLLRKLNVFDVYEGDKIGSHEKAYALSFILQDNEKTLNDQIIDKTMERLMGGFERELEANIRK